MSRSEEAKVSEEAVRKKDGGGGPREGSINTSSPRTIGSESSINAGGSPGGVPGGVVASIHSDDCGGLCVSRMSLGAGIEGVLSDPI